MQAMQWVLLAGFVGVVCSLAAYLVMRSRMEAAVARERERLAEARGLLEAQKQTMEEGLKNAREAGRREAMDEFLADLRIEQRHHVRTAKVLFLQRKSLVLQERIFFRNIPLSNWIEHEILLEEGADIESVVRSLTVFDAEMKKLDGAPPRRKLIR